jgi:hypothetical protein
LVSKSDLHSLSLLTFAQTARSREPAEKLSFRCTRVKDGRLLVLRDHPIGEHFMFISSLRFSIVKLRYLGLSFRICSQSTSLWWLSSFSGQNWDISRWWNVKIQTFSIWWRIRNFSGSNRKNTSTIYPRLSFQFSEHSGLATTLFGSGSLV